MQQTYTIESFQKLIIFIFQFIINKPIRFLHIIYFFYKFNISFNQFLLSKTRIIAIIF